jgi:hypothetical protein
MELTEIVAVIGALILFINAGECQTVLSPGDVSIVGIAMDSPDAVAIVIWVDLENGTQILFTDKGWNCSGFRSGESVLTYTAPSPVTKGTVIAFVHGDEVTKPDIWDLDGGWLLSGTNGDAIIVFQGTVESPTPIYALDLTDGWETCGDEIGNYESTIPDGLINGATAVSWEHRDNIYYRPWYATSATLETLKEWMTMESRFIRTSSGRADYEVPASFRALEGVRGYMNYTEYIPGTAPCIFLTGHDGQLEPSYILKRDHGCYIDGACVWNKTCGNPSEQHCRAVTKNDENTQDMARRALDHFEAHIGERCHLVVSRLAREKLDPNREIDQAAMGDPDAIQAYNDFHAYATMARQAIESSTCGAGVVIDFHGHSHPEGRIELGYKLSAGQLNYTDVDLDALIDSTSIKNLVSVSGASLSTLVHGSVLESNPSMGSLFMVGTSYNASGYIAVPSEEVPYPPENEDYFQGGYNIEVHGSEDGGTVDGIQIEFPRWIRAEDYDGQADMLEAFGTVILPQYLVDNYGFANAVCPDATAVTGTQTTTTPTDTTVTSTIVLTSTDTTTTGTTTTTKTTATGAATTTATTTCNHLQPCQSHKDCLCSFKCSGRFKRCN